MSQFVCEVVRVSIETHPNGDAIEIAKVGGYLSIVLKDQFKTGDLAVYIPEGAIVPEWMLKKLKFWDELNSKGLLSGGAGNRVKAKKIRGVLSQGILYPAEANVLAGDYAAIANDVAVVANAVEGTDLAEFLGVTKYEPSVPSHMKGKIAGAAWDATFNYDFDNVKKKMDLFEGQMVAYTEKIHGTFLQVGVVPARMADEKFYGGRVILSSKGLGSKGFILDHNDDTNLYVQVAKKFKLLDVMLEMAGDADLEDQPLFIMGEVYGKTGTGGSVQAGFDYGQTDLQFAMFDAANGCRGQEEFMDMETLSDFADYFDIPMVPILAIGEFSIDKMNELTNGKETVSGRGVHIREGVVIKSLSENSPHGKWGRRIAKSISEAYLLRKGEVTEFQ